ncbi:IMPACT family protein [Enemella evansiae]|uniref:IMPACT family protein n=1 Tax=Enemella evansiae TaxID=2016499 RepID=UPI000B963A56|nr:YigZ family protein [Enemella evansiae]OYO01627.1 IMPACT family protein [Enemella evansiae]OYO03628.1 IMPACT family protein [Enemella evansiae]PFG68441.1 putative YigZ family protein [Propionibacteriaceae bacterium ES.041]
MTYLTLAAGTAPTAEIEVKRSRFLAVVRRVDDEAAARAVIEEQRRTHRDARHHCTAFILGPAPAIMRSNDDGEPSGTAGAPMLEILRGKELSDVVAVVTRWFGGTLLGTGGLTRAYGDAVRAALVGARLVRRTERARLDLDLPHADAGRVEAELRDAGVAVLGADYGASVRLRLAADDPDALTARIAELTAGASAPIPAGSVWVDLPVTVIE